MFQSLSEKLENAFKKFKNKGKLTEADIKAGMREIKLALLEADVSFKVVKEFIKTVSDRAVGSEVLESLLPPLRQSPQCQSGSRFPNGSRPPARRQTAREKDRAA